LFSFVTGESFYQPYLARIVEELMRKGISREVDGAQMIQMDGMEFPLVIRKSDGGYTYATTDLAALWYRLHVDKLDWLIYVTDAGTICPLLPLPTNACQKVKERFTHMVTYKCAWRAHRPKETF
jgi:arginyl-tRNA synthetase